MKPTLQEIFDTHLLNNGHIAHFHVTAERMGYSRSQSLKIGMMLRVWALNCYFPAKSVIPYGENERRARVKKVYKDFNDALKRYNDFWNERLDKTQKIG